MHALALRTALVLATLGLTPACATSRTAPPPASASLLQRKLTDVASSSTGIVAVTVLNLRTGERASVHGAVRLPMMSVFKLPLAIAALSHVDDGSYRLDQPITIAEPELRPGVSPIAEEWKKGQHTFTLETTLRWMLQDSDNTAGDKLVALLGPKDVTARLRAFGMNGVDVAEQEIEIFARTHCPGSPPPPDGWTFPRISACPNATPEVHRAAAQHEIDASPNAATTDALVDMLAILERGAALSPSSRTWLRETLAGTKTGAARMRAGVPAGTRVEHKTGTGDTIEGVNIATNDVGVVTLPNGDRFAIAVLTAGTRGEDATRERVIAQLTQSAWSHFVGAEPGT